MIPLAAVPVIVKTLAEAAAVAFAVRLAERAADTVPLLP